MSKNEKKPVNLKGELVFLYVEMNVNRYIPNIYSLISKAFLL